MHTTLKCDALPIADLLEFLLGREVIVEVMEDNTSAIADALAGYSTKLRYLHRARRSDLEWLGEVFSDPRHKLLYTPSAEQKGDLLTKEFDRAKFEACKKLVGLSCCVLPAAIARRLVRESTAMPSALRSQREGLTQDVLKAGIDFWVIDTGSGHHLVPAKNMTAIEKEQFEPDGPTLKLATANGIISDKRTTCSNVSQLGFNVVARVLSNTPRVLSVSQLVAAGAEFRWTGSGATLKFGGRVIELQVQQGVPLLALPAIERSGSG